jgi:hypothetical protein
MFPLQWALLLFERDGVFLRVPAGFHSTRCLFNWTFELGRSGSASCFHSIRYFCNPARTCWPCTR